MCAKGRTPLDETLRWVADAVEAEIEAMQPLRNDHAPWKVQFHGRDSDAVLRITQPGWRNADPIRTNAAALLVAERNGVAAPRLLAVDWDGELAGTPATLETALTGSSASPAHVSPGRLRAFGAAIAKVHQIPLEPQAALPYLTRSKQYDHPMVRRWAALYNSSSEEARPEVIRAYVQLTGRREDGVRRTLETSQPGSALLQLADERIRALPRPQERSVFLHGDIWTGNSLWDGDTCLALIDWKDAGVGDPGIDLGLLRLNMAIEYGSSAAAYVLEGWQSTAGRVATNVAYWDAVAALNTPTALEDLSFTDGGASMTAETTTERRDAFLRDALSALP